MLNKYIEKREDLYRLKGKKYLYKLSMKYHSKGQLLCGQATQNILKKLSEHKNKNFNVNHKQISHIRRSLGLKTVSPRPKFNSSEPHPEHEKFPYLLRDLKIVRPNQL